MPFVTSKEMLINAKKGQYAVGAFNVENMEMVKAVIQAAEELRAPIIVQTTPSTVLYGGLKTYFANVKAVAEEASIPVALHLDHGNSFDLVVKAIREGYTSIMIDGSQYSFEDNITLTKKVVEVANACNIPVEAELGKVGGKEEDLELKVDVNTNPEEAKEFVERTGISSLAVAIGTAHGFYSGTPVLDKDRLSEIRDRVNVPIVLHGGSGLPDKDIRDCIERGICKVNYATELRAAYTNGIKEVLHNKPQTIDPKLLGRAGIKNVIELVKSRILACGCDKKC